MPWSDSRIFRQWLADSLAPAPGFTGRWDPGGTPPLADGDYMVALFDTTVTPDETAARAATAYGGGVWAAGEVATAPAGNWPPGGVPLTSVVYVEDGQVVVFAADDTTASPVTLTGACGDLIYFADASSGQQPIQASQGAAFHDFGGPASVTGGVFMVAWSPQGIMLVTV
jgi:hypothetical protein